MEFTRLQREQTHSDSDERRTRSTRPSSLAGPSFSVLDTSPPLLRLGTHSTPIVQAKLSISHPGDQYEQEADRIAEQVMGTNSLPAGAEFTAKPLAFGIQRRAHANTNSNVTHSSDLTGSLGSGQPLDHATSEFFESRFGTDLSDVRIHAGTEAADSARSINARAYTIGHNIVMGSGEYQPHTHAGKQLLAHELAHTVQQGHGPTPAVQRKLQVDPGLSLDTQGFTTTKTGDVYTCPAVVKKSVYNETFTALLHSPRVFKLAGTTNAQVNANLAKHMSARLGIVDFASKKKYTFGAGSAFKMNPDFWTDDPAAGWIPKPGVERKKAIDDLNVHPDKYTIACLMATQLTMEGGGKSTLTQDNGVALDDWIPGDWGYIKNTKFPAVGGIPGLEGENIIYAGKDKFWGHFGPGNEYKTLQEWFDTVKSWNGGALHRSYRHRPTIGLG